MIKISDLEKDTLENLYQDIVGLKNYWPLRENIYNLFKEYNQLITKHRIQLFESFEFEYISLLSLLYATFSRLAGAHYQLGEVKAWIVKPLPKEHKECFIFESWECFYADLNRSVNTMVNIIFGICFGQSTKGKSLNELIKTINEKDKCRQYLSVILPQLDEITDILQIRNHIEHYWRPIFYIDEEGEYLISKNFVKGLLLSHQGQIDGEGLINITEKAASDLLRIEAIIDHIFNLLNTEFLPKYFERNYLSKSSDW